MILIERTYKSSFLGAALLKVMEGVVNLLYNLLFL